MSTQVFLNLLNELWKRNKKVRLAEHFLSLFRNEYIKFNNTRAPMLDSIYHMTFKLLSNLIIVVKTLKLCHNVRKRYYGHHNVS